MTETELEYQFCFNCNDRKNCYTKPKDCTRIKEEIGLQDMTNEEWFCSLSTEEKAKFFDKICYSAWGDINSRFRDMADYTDWVVWLKQPHSK